MLQAWEAPYQFPMPLEGRYWDGDFRCDGDENRPCRGAESGPWLSGFVSKVFTSSHVFPSSISCIFKMQGFGVLTLM